MRSVFKKHLLLLFLFCSSKSFSQKEPKEIFDKMMASIKSIKGCSFVLDMQERIKDEYRYDEYVVKLNTNPYKVYVYSVTPNPGAECLLVAGENNDKAYINPNRFPFITLSLSPQNMLLRKKHQYTISQLGFGFISEVLDNYIRKNGDSFYSHLQMQPDTVLKGKTYCRLIIDQKDFHYDNYKVQPGETMTTIGRKLFVNDNMILEANPGYKHFDDVKAGDVIKVPNFFGKKIVLYINKVTFLPLVHLIYDDKGLYTRLEFSGFILNPDFKIDEFSKKNKKYGF